MDTPDISHDEVKLLLSELLIRAVRDLLILEPQDLDFKTAFNLLFDEDYLIYWDSLDKDGEQLEDGCTLSLDEILEIVDLTKEFIQCQIRNRMYEMRRPLAVQLFHSEEIPDWRTPLQKRIE